MTDINEWNLTYGKAGGNAANFDFGSIFTSDYPFEVQMEIGDADRVTQDVASGTDDAIFMGRDLVTAMDLTFSVTTIPEDTDQINAALDAVSNFAGIWRAYQLSKNPGQLAILKNVLRNRYVVGRPRNFSRKNDRLRKGIIGFDAQFRTVSPEFYKLPVRTLSPVRTISTAMTPAGDVPAFPIITFTGKFTTASLQWSPGGLFTPWTITCNHARDTGETFTIDTRAWNRGTYSETNGQATNGWLAGSQIADCFIDPDAPSGHFLFTTTGTTDGSTKCDIEWYDTYAGL